MTEDETVVWYCQLNGREFEQTLGDAKLGVLQSMGLSRVFSNTTEASIQNHQFFSAQFYNPTLRSIHDYWKNHSFD